MHATGEDQRLDPARLAGATPTPLRRTAPADARQFDLSPVHWHLTAADDRGIFNGDLPAVPQHPLSPVADPEPALPADQIFSLFLEFAIHTSSAVIDPLPAREKHPTALAIESKSNVTGSAETSLAAAS